MDYDFCQKVKCGLIPQASVSMQDLYSCSVEYGAGVLFPCHVDCVEYGGCAVPPIALPLPLLGPTAVALENYHSPNELPAPPVRPLLIKDVIQPIPDLVAMQVPLVSSQPCGEEWWMELNISIRENPLCALALLGVGVLVLRSIKK